LRLQQARTSAIQKGEHAVRGTITALDQSTGLLSLRTSAGETTSISRLKWVIGTPYFVQGTSNLATVQRAAVGVLAFPLSFFLYLDPTHPWWRVIFWFVPDTLPLLEGWNRYAWFRLVTQIVLGFATLPAFIIPLILAGETVKVEHTGVSYAFLIALANVTDMLEGAVGAGLYSLLTLPFMDGLLAAFQGSVFNIARTQDKRTVASWAGAGVCFGTSGLLRTSSCVSLTARRWCSRSG
jgi:hypothetical protein